MIRKLGGLLVFLGLVFIGMFFYQEYVGDIPFVNNLLSSVSGNNGAFVTSIGVKKVNALNYEIIAGEDHIFDVEELDDNVNASYSFNVLLNNNMYKFSFNYPDYLSLSSADNDMLVFSNDGVEMIINYYAVVSHDELIADFDSSSMKSLYSHYFIKNFNAPKNSVSKIYITNECLENEKYFLDRVSYDIYDITEKANRFGITLRAFNKRLPDSLIANIYNSFTFEKVDDDLNLCDKKNDKYVCSFNTSAYGLSSEKNVSIEFPSDLYEFRNVHNSLPVLIPSEFRVKTNLDVFPLLVHFSVEYDANNNYLNGRKYVEETIDGRKFMVRRIKDDPVNTFYVYEIEPNVYLNVSINSVEEGFEEDEKEFGRTDFKIEDLDKELYNTVTKTFLDFKVN